MLHKNHRACIISDEYPAISCRGIRPSRQSPIIRASTATWLVARGNKETFSAQIIVAKELPPEEYLYLHFLTASIGDGALANQLAEDYKEHQDEDIYISYMQQITTANIKTKGDSPMVCEGILNLCGTSSEEIIERTKKEEAEYYMPKINQLST